MIVFAFIILVHVCSQTFLRAGAGEGSYEKLTPRVESFCKIEEEGGCQFFVFKNSLTSIVNGPLLHKQYRIK